MQRRILAAVALGLLLSAVAIWLWWPEAEIPLSCCWRGGAIFGAAWLAYDDVQRLPSWLLVVLPGVVIVLVRWPRLFPMVVAALIAYGMLRRFLGPIGGRPR